ncbi:hypothetical protein [Nocardiopsis aegyptia]|uniref:EcsC family protein n=1 Tax=Nocardiopsis aegyptia TaxID=220378 RepID=A0A7Z0ESM5_9ACTN|nr:hypothetical protein [Nocardiopsis aegyptia]NYJ37522.1 hypothetical protein [Nocardiopsis aegyptia]
MHDDQQPENDGPREDEHPGEGEGRDAERRELGVLVGRILSEELATVEGDAEGEGAAERRRRLRELVGALGASARSAGLRGVAAGRWLSETFAEEIAPRVPIRDHATLVRHHGGLDGEELADALQRTAVRATTAVGMAGGALSAVQWAAPPLLLATPARLAAETLLVAAVEVKLIGELHELYDAPVTADGGLRRNAGYLGAWVHRRGVDPTKPEETLLLAVGAAAKTALRDRLLRLLGRNLTTLGPYLTGAAAGGVVNRLATGALAARVRADLRAQSITRGGDPGELES